MATLDSERSKPWIDWLQAQANELDREGQDNTPSSSTPLAPIQPGDTTLFTVEPANLFRDGQVDAQRAQAILEAANRRRSS